MNRWNATAVTAENHRRRCIVFKKYATISRYFPPTRVTFSIYLAFTPKPDVS